MIYLNTARNNVTFEKSVKQIIKEAPNAELKNIIKDATAFDYGIAIQRGIPSLIEYANKGKTEKQQVVSIMEDLIESEELQKSPIRDILFYGPINLNKRDGKGKIAGERYESYPGYIGAYQKLTGVRLNVVV